MTVAANSLPTVFMFSGQGSHYYQMGHELFARHAGFHRRMEEMDEVVQDLGCPSVIRALYDPARGKGDRFDALSITNPAIFMVEFALVSELIESGMVPDGLLGASLGSFAAAAIAGCLSRDEALRLVVELSQIVSERCERGGMIAVLGDPALLHHSMLATHCELAGTSMPSHFTVAAPERNLPLIEQHLSGIGATFQRLSVAYAFHSRWIDGVREAVLALGASVTLRPPKIPLVCCTRAQGISQLAPDYFWTVVRQPVRLWDTILYLEKNGPHNYLDVGPGASLATLVKYARPQGSRSSVRATLSPFGDDWKTLQTLQPALQG